MCYNFLIPPSNNFFIIIIRFYKDLENKLFIKPGDVSKLADILRKRGLKSAVEKLEQYQSEGNFVCYV